MTPHYSGTADGNNHRFFSFQSEPLRLTSVRGYKQPNKNDTMPCLRPEKARISMAKFEVGQMVRDRQTKEIVKVLGILGVRDGETWYEIGLPAVGGELMLGMVPAERPESDLEETDVQPL
jgi:hypothetical protein